MRAFDYSLLETTTCRSLPLEVELPEAVVDQLVTAVAPAAGAIRSGST